MSPFAARETEAQRGKVIDLQAPQLEHHLPTLSWPLPLQALCEEGAAGRKDAAMGWDCLTWRETQTLFICLMLTGMFTG